MMLIIIFRVRSAWRELCGQHTSPITLAKEDLQMALEKSKAIAAEIDAAADRLIALSQGTDAELTAAQHALADADDEMASTMQPIADKLNAAAPALVLDPAAAVDGSAADAAAAGMA